MAISEIPSLHLKPVAYKTNKLYLKLPEGSIGNMTFARADINASRVNKQGLVEFVATGIPRLDYPLINGVVQSCPDLLLELTRTNICLRSEELDNVSWLKNNLTVTANATTSPDGTNNADKVLSTTGVGFLRQIISVSSNTDYVFTFYSKKGTASELKYSIFDDTNSVDIISPTSYHSQIGSGWNRIKISFTTPLTCTSIAVYPIRDSGVIGYSYIWGTHLELGDANSYIKTVASAVTRATETLTDAGDSTTFNSEEGVLYVEFSTLSSAAPTSNMHITINDGTTNNRTYIFISTSKQIHGVGFVSNVLQFNINSVVLSDLSEVRKVALKWKVNDFALWIDGVEVDTEGAGSVNPANTFNKFSFESGANDFYGRIRDLRVYKTALTDSELTELTT